MQALFKLYEGYSSFSWYRMPDAHAGSLKTALADYMTMHKQQFRLVEVKEVAHGYRFPHKNFDADKVARIRTWVMAGASASVVIAFRPPEGKTVWRVSELDRFLVREGGSWDLRDLPELTVQQALESIYGPLPPKRT